MLPPKQATLPMLIVASVILLLTPACAENAEQDAAPGAATAATSNEGSTRSEETEAFCDAIKALNQTDGTTDDQFVLEVLDRVRATAPDQLKDDVKLLHDNLILNNYPSGVEPSMKEAPLEESTSAGERLGAYVEQHCDLDG